AKRFSNRPKWSIVRWNLSVDHLRQGTKTVRRVDRLQTLEGRQLRSLARTDQLRADLRRVAERPPRIAGRLAGRFEFSELLEQGKRLAGSRSPMDDDLFDSKGLLSTPRYWRRVT